MRDETQPENLAGVIFSEDLRLVDARNLNRFPIDLAAGFFYDLNQMFHFNG
jgi:hypothetical protein